MVWLRPRQKSAQVRFRLARGISASVEVHTGLYVALVFRSRVHQERALPAERPSSMDDLTRVECLSCDFWCWCRHVIFPLYLIQEPEPIPETAGSVIIEHLRSDTNRGTLLVHLR
jgi:hypothetical protein